MSLQAAEILTTAQCPNNCKYCYISKDRVMKRVHQEVVDDLRSGVYVSRLKELYGDNLTDLGFWGAEPVLTLDEVIPLLPELSQVFPKLRKVNFSTSMIDYKSIFRFAQAIAQVGLNLGVQVSLDGPAFITDTNRFRGAAEIIPNNLFNLLSLLQDSKANVEFHWKATLDINNIREMKDDPAKVDEYFNFFKQLNERIDRENGNENIKFHKGSFIPTLAVPGKYTSDDGRDFAGFIKLLREKGYRTVYTDRILRLIDFEDELGPKKGMFTCSGGDSNRGVSDSYHICHRTFYLDDDRCVGAILKKNWDYTHYQKGTLDLVREYFIVGRGDNAAMARFQYALRSYHDFWRAQVGYIKAMMKELALAGQASHEYLDNDELSTFFALFVDTCLGCPVENLLNTGCLHLTPISLLRMFGNGAFREILNGLRR